MQKSKTIDQYVAQYVVAICSAKTKEEIAAIVDKIYQDGFEDGVNNA